MQRNSRMMINDIEDCLAQAHLLTQQNTRQPLYKVFKCLAGDETTGLVAYAIWRGRSQIISILNSAPDYLQSGASISRASRT